MRPLQKEIIEALHVKRDIVPEEEIRHRIHFMKAYAQHAHAKGFILGLSLGQDSTLAGKLAQLAVDELNEENGGGYQFIGMRLPYGKQKDEADAKAVIDFIRPNMTYIFDIANAVDALKKTYDAVDQDPLSDYQKGNVKARMRMVAQYAFAGTYNLLVIGTDHAAEALTGFYTKYGDGAADLLPLAGLTKRQGKMLLKQLGCPEHLYLKTPTADLLDEKPLRADEDELGLTYDDIDNYLEGYAVDDAVSKKIEDQYLKTRHKRVMPASMFDDWWQ
ncbi:ammonia-dependent NAD(+) synthetase [Camelliibacillus cellulosilyticus]|uniref:NH(3)-dependent NAD(+) synthetase n=1 Tax=Camelliibacillus cellulosilyticus TaxID=2174486 RepID=A0ABV9GMX5_9BACL